MFEESIPHVGNPILYLTHQICWRCLDRWWTYAPKFEFETTFPGSGILPVPLLTPVFVCDLHVCMKFLPNDLDHSIHKSPMPHWQDLVHHLCLSEWSADPETNQNGGTILLITNLHGRLWIGKPGFLFEFPSNHTFISLSFGYSRVTDRRTNAQTNGWTTQTMSITIAAPTLKQAS